MTKTIIANQSDQSGRQKKVSEWCTKDKTKVAVCLQTQAPPLSQVNGTAVDK